MDKNSTTQVFLYNNNPVSFQMGAETMINANQMSKSFGKRPTHWLVNQSTKDFLIELASVRNLTPSDLVIVRNGDNGGTWMHEDVALEFARWLSPIFAIWCNDRIKELLQFGITATPEMLAKAVADPMFVLKLLAHIKDEAEKRDQLNGRMGILEEKLEAQSPKVTFFDNVHQAIEEGKRQRTYIVSKIASPLKMRATDLNQFLRRKGIQKKQAGMWVLTEKYKDMGYAKTKTQFMGVDEFGDDIINTYLVWTQKGRDFIHSLFEG